MLEKAKTLAKQWYAPILLFFLLMLGFHALVTLGSGDDAAVLAGYGEQPFFPSLVDMYRHWTPRVVIHGAVLLCLKHPLLWRLLNPAMMALLCYATCRLLSCKERKCAALLCLGFLVIPMRAYMDAGWITTSVTYLWTLALGAFSLLPIKAVMDGRRMNRATLILCVPALLYACNQEQMNLVLLGLYGVFALLSILQKKRGRMLLLTGFALALGSMIFTLTCPGAFERAGTETASHFAAFEGMSLPSKLELGFSSTWHHLVMQPSILFPSLAALLAAGVFLRSRSVIKRLVSLVPLLCYLVFVPFLPMFGDLPTVLKIAGAITETGTNPTLGDLNSLLPDAIFCVVLFCAALSLPAALPDRREGFVMLLVLALGFGSRMAMGLTPTVWYSGERTYLFLDYAMVCVCVKLFSASSDERKAALLLCAVPICVIAQFTGGMWIYR